MGFPERTYAQCDHCRGYLHRDPLSGEYGVRRHEEVALRFLSETQASTVAVKAGWYVDAHTARCHEHWPVVGSVDPATDTE